MHDPAKIHALLEELRSWEVGELRHSVHELAARFGLEPFVIQQIAKSEGIKLKIGEVGSDDVDDRLPTRPMEPIAWPKDEDEDEDG
jgi:hypothetical protein